jgi:hypothetical protein
VFLCALCGKILPRIIEQIPLFAVKMSFNVSNTTSLARLYDHFVVDIVGAELSVGHPLGSGGTYGY